MFSLRILLVMGLLVPAARAEVILYVDRQSCFPMAPFQPAFAYVMAYDPSNHGFTELQFAIAGLPVDVLAANLTPFPAGATLSGNPFTGSGCTISFPDCTASGVFGPVVVLSFQLLALLNASDPLLQVTGASDFPPSVGCPLVTRCDGGGVECGVGMGSSNVYLPPGNPFPADGATRVALDTRPHWTGVESVCTSCLSVPCYGFFFGTEPDPPQVWAECDAPFDYDPGPLAPSTTYYWRVVENWCGSRSSPVWSFTTEPPIGVDTQSWSRVKQLYRSPAR